MKRDMYRFTFDDAVPFEEIDLSLLLAVLAAESLHGRSMVRLDASFTLDPKTRSLVVDAATDVGRAITNIFTGFLSREFGEESFAVERVKDGNLTVPEAAGTL